MNIQSHSVLEVHLERAECFFCLDIFQKQNRVVIRRSRRSVESAYKELPFIRPGPVRFRAAEERDHLLPTKEYNIYLRTPSNT